MRLTVCAIARNEARFIKNFVDSASLFADKVIIGDMESTDGTQAIATERGALVHTIKFRSFLEQGFSWARNELIPIAEGCGCDWVHWLDIDERVTKAHGEEIRKFSGDASRFIETSTFNSVPQNFDIEKWESYLGDLPVSTHPHMRSHPSNLGYHWRGYIHEELYRQDTHAFSICIPSPVHHWHFTNMNPKLDYPKPLLYGFMLNRGSKNPELQRWTNSWWYVDWLKRIPHEEQAQAFRKLCSEAEGL